MSDLRVGILSEIKRLATATGQPPGKQLFEKETGIGESKWRGVFWARWGDALVEAGFQPNNFSVRKDTDDLLIRFAELTLTAGKIPTRSEIDMMRRTDSSIPATVHIIGHFGGKAGLAKALIDLSARDERFAALSQIVVVEEDEKSTSGKTSTVVDGWVYLLKSGENYKIGRSDNLERRVKQISVAMPEATNLFHAIQTDDPVGIEEYWHKRFSDRRQNGE